MSHHEKHRMTFGKPRFWHSPFTDTWGQLVLPTTILNHKICINTSRQVLEKILFAINAIFSE